MNDTITAPPDADAIYLNGASANGAHAEPDEDDVDSFADVSDVPNNQIRAFPLDEMGNARRLQCYFGGGLLYSTEANGWYVWDGRRWTTDKIFYAKDCMTKAVQSIHQEARRVGKGELVSPVKDDDKATAAEKIIKWHSKSRNNAPVNNSLSLAQRLLPVLLEEFDRHQYLLNVNNGTLNLKSGKIRPHDRRHNITRLCPVDYDPNAVYLKWDQFLFEVFEGDREMLEYIQRFACFCLTGDTRD